MVGLVRLELTTSRLSSARSNQLSYKPTKSLLDIVYKKEPAIVKYPPAGSPRHRFALIAKAAASKSNPKNAGSGMALLGTR